MNTVALVGGEPREANLALERLPAPTFVWVDQSPAEANTFVLFRRIIVIGEQLRSAKIKLFADTRYRLFVNDTIVGYGPCRFVPRAPQYDEYDLSAYLVRGRNCITVEVHHRGENSFQATPSTPGFTAWGTISDGKTEISLETPGLWKARKSQARVREAPVFSFALPSVEMLDVSELAASSLETNFDDSWVVPLSLDSKAWGKLTPRLVPQASDEMIAPARAVFSGSLRSDEDQVIFHRRFEGPPTNNGKSYLCFAFWLHSPIQQSVDLAVFWGRHFVNGIELQPSRDLSRGNRETARASLAEGWNLFYGEVEVLASSWGFTVGWPRRAELVFAAVPSNEARGTFLVSDLTSREALHRLKRPAAQKDLAEMNGFFSQVSPTAENSFPARECAWHAAGENVAREGAIEFPIEVPRSERGEGAVVVDFEREWIGHPMVEVECAAPCILDIANDEALRGDGLLRFYESIHLINNVDRFWVPAGKHRIESFHERGGRYLQVNVRSEAPVTLRRVGVRSALANLPVRGSFACSDPLLNWIWATGIETLQASMTDCWIDPWREQGCYLGDVYVQWLATRMYTSDLRLIRRCFQLWEQCQREDGQMPAVVPAHYTVAHPDYTLIWILLLRDYLRWTHDVDQVRRLWPTVEKIWRSPLWKKGATELWDGTDIKLFGDWGATVSSRDCDGSLLLNAFRVGALQASAEIAAALDARDGAEAFAIEADQVAAEIRRQLWDPERGAFAAGLLNGGRLTETPVHGNILALLFGISSPENDSALIESVLQSIRQADDSTASRHDGHCDFYFLNYALTMLHNRGRHAEAFEIIRKYWGSLKKRGSLTFPEIWPLITEGTGSYCHGWSCSPLISIASELLGVKPAGKMVLVRPQFPTGIEFVRGTHPHPRGDIEIEWSRRDDVVRLDVQAPRGLVQIDVPEGIKSTLIEH